MPSRQEKESRRERASDHMENTQRASELASKRRRTRDAESGSRSRVAEGSLRGSPILRLLAQLLFPALVSGTGRPFPC